jgi:DNA-directed RNA polymerase subunit E'/Rpb7
MDQLFISTKIKSSLSVYPKDLNNNLNRKIVNKIKNDVEGKCITNGYVKPGSVKLLKRSLGETLTSQFNGAVVYHIEYLVDLCNPLEGANIECQVLNINKMGVLAGMIGEIDSPLNILLAKQHHIDNAEFEDLKELDIINIKVLGKRYEYGDSQISIIGLLESEYIKQNNIVDEDDDEDIEQMSNEGSINSLSFKSNSPAAEDNLDSFSLKPID